MVPEVTTFYGGVLALWLLVLAERIPRLRRLHKIGVGTGGNEELSLAVRCHGNAAEYVPVGILLLLLAELNQAPLAFLHAAGIGFTLGRVLHAWGLSKSQGQSFGRFWGTALTWVVLLVLSIVCIYLSIW